MTRLLAYLPALACPVAMGSLMWLMARSKKPASATPAATPAQQAELQALRAELDGLRSDETKRVAS